MAEVRFRVRGPGWTETVSLAEDKTFGELEQWITAKRNVKNFQLKYGFPPKTIDSTAKGVTLKELKLKGETLTLVPAESTSSAEPGSSTATSQAPIAMPTPQRAESFKPKPVDAEVSDLKWPDRDGFLVLRVMPDDNSCLFTAFGGVIPLDDPAPVLRQKVANYILEHKDQYNKVVLEVAPEIYARRIQQPENWGGAIELGILSDIYKIEICSIDVKSLRVDRFGEGKDTRCILVYSGIHYDRIAYTSELDLPVECDVVKWRTDDDEVVEKARELCKKLQEKHYFTDVHDMVTQCKVPGCGWIGQGQKSIADHMKTTGHSDFNELLLDE